MVRAATPDDRAPGAARRGLELGSYRLSEPVGAGGMGEVWLAEDLRLGRTVAVKILGGRLAEDPRRLAAFEREARAVAALEHSNIVAIHDVGATATADGTLHYIVMEAVKGESLRARLDHGLLSIERVLRLGVELAEALTAAHSAGVLHLDLKPENVLITPDGRAKLVDFGLARLEEPADAARVADPSSTATSVEPLLHGGSPGYMAPEQIEGGVVDGRADVFALGALLFEAVSGMRAFAGRTVVEVLHRTLHGSTPTLGGTAPPQLDWILQKCLSASPEDRYQHAADLAVDLRRTSRDLAASAIGPGATGRRAAPLVAAAVTAVVLPLAAWGAWTARTAGREPPPLIQLEVGLPDGHAFGSTGRVLAIAPDGRRVAFVTTDPGGQRRMFLRELGALEAVAVPGSEGALRPFFSPDGRWIGFSTFGELRKVAVAGGEASTVTTVNGSPDATWLPDGRILYEQPDGLWLVDSDGTDRVRVASPRPDLGIEELERPAPLPGGTHALLEIGTTEGQDSVGLIDLASGAIVTLVRDGSSPRWDPSGHVVFSRRGTLFAAPFDVRRLRTTGPPFPVLEGVHTEGRGAAQFDVAGTGALLYVPGSGVAGRDALAWIDEDGSAQPVPGSQREGEIRAVRLAPDGRQVALSSVLGADSDVWIFDLVRHDYRRVTSSGTADQPAWSRDGRWIYYTEDRGGDLDVHRRVASLAEPARPVIDGPGDQVITDVAPDGLTLIFTAPGEGGAMQTWRAAADGSGAPDGPLVPGHADMAAISPDGRWIAYRSSDSGRREVWVRRLGLEGAPVQVSTDGGTQPGWTADSRLLLRAGDGALVEATPDGDGWWRPRTRLAASIPANRWVAAYDATEDGRILVPWRSVRSGIERIATDRMVRAENWLRPPR